MDNPAPSKVGGYFKATDEIDPVYGPQVLERPRVLDARERRHGISPAALELEGQVAKHPKTCAVILAGGVGERFGSDQGKQLYEVCGKPLLTWSAEVFDSVADVGQIVIVCPPERRQEYCQQAIDRFPFVTPVSFADAGQVRQQSSYAGVQAVPEQFELIALHDGARPLISADLVKVVIDTVKGDIDIDGAVIGYPAIDTLKLVDRERNIIGTPDRSQLWLAQTPQVFRAAVIREAHQLALSDGFIATDDATLVERIGGRLSFVVGPRDNIKLTMPEDLTAIQAGLKRRLGQSSKQRVG
ncbi:MAG: 2-C-methyl-D-erythritol 4-phosphate cytidylyltransferase [Coriobacteriales bacterium]|jgi:2-C-methyl-D-erythritol 4-phosphate cytidylyltransferase|nr:2-C-methyl-D-erythritol 4-phosphate cytidylyltransferase [Coriobacteriales bacterium]